MVVGIDSQENADNPPVSEEAYGCRTNIAYTFQLLFAYISADGRRLTIKAGE